VARHTQPSPGATDADSLRALAEPVVSLSAVADTVEIARLATHEGAAEVAERLHANGIECNETAVGPVVAEIGDDLDESRRSVGSRGA
jgi:hypothetical protein